MKVLVFDHEVLVLFLNIWSWSLKSCRTFVVILDGSEQGTPWHFVRQQKQFAIQKPLFLAVLHAHQPQLRGYLTIYLLGHIDASKA